MLTADLSFGHGLLLDGNRLLLTRHQIRVPSQSKDEPRYEDAGVFQIRGKDIGWKLLETGEPNIDAAVLQLDGAVPPVAGAYEPVEIDFESPLKVGQRVFFLSSDPFVSSASPKATMTWPALAGMSIDEITAARVMKSVNEVADGPVPPDYVPLNARFGAFAVLYDNDPRLPTHVEGRSGSPAVILRDGRPVIIGVVSAAMSLETYRSGANANDPDAVSWRTVIGIARPKFDR